MNASTLKYEIDKVKKENIHNKRKVTVFIIIEIILTTLFFIFVVNKGNLFDYISSIAMLIFIFILIFQNINRILANNKKLIKLLKEYKISTETKEEKLNRIRIEKFNRIL